MSQKTTIKIFIASAGEMKPERDQVDHVFTRLSKIHKHLTLEPMKYEYDINPGSQPGFDTIQDNINTKLKESDFGVFIFYSRIGQYTRVEVEYALNNSIKFFTFFKSGFSPESEQIDAYKDLLNFKKSLSATVLKQPFDGTRDFDHSLYETLNQYLLEKYALIDIEKYDKTVKTLSESNQRLILLLTEKEAEIKELKTKSEPDSNEVKKLEDQIAEIKKELLQSEEIRQHQAKEKAELEQQLLPQKAKNELKAKAFNAIEQGNYEDAESFLIQSARESVEETASTFYELGKIKKLQFKYTESLNYFELAIKINPDDIQYLYEAGMIADGSGFYDKALMYHEKALLEGKKQYGEKHPKVANLYTEIGVAFFRKGDYDKAMQHFEIALTINKKFQKHSNIAIVYNNFGLVYRNKNQYDKAILYYKKALKIEKKIYGHEYPNIAIRYINLGSAYRFKCEYDKAIRYFKKALIIYKKFHSEEYIDIAVGYNNLSLAYNNKGDYDKAILYVEKALDIGKKFHSEGHPAIAIWLNNLGLIYHTKREYNKAIKFYQQSLSIFQKFLSPEHPNIQTVKQNLTAAQTALAQQNNPNPSSE